MTIRKTSLICYASGVGAQDERCAKGPEVILNAPEFAALKAQFQRIDIVQSVSTLRKLEAIPEIKRLAIETADLTEKSHFFLVLGGDHTSAIGTFKGAAKKLQNRGELGLLWIDAHLDSHTPETSITHNPHGMPLAVLLGCDGFDGPTLKPQNVCVIGARSYEPEERALLETLNLRIFYMDEVKQRGLDVVFQEALAIVQANTAGFGISFDLDALDPEDAPGTGVKEPDGIRATAMLAQLKGVAPLSNFVGMDITEFNPDLDVDCKTQRVILETIGLML